MIYIINSAMMPYGCYGQYEYMPATLDNLKTIFKERWGGYESHIGYEQNILLIEKWTGKKLKVSRKTIDLEPGDQMFVMRLKYRVEDPMTKGREVSADPDDWEFAWVEYAG